MSFLLPLQVAVVFVVMVVAVLAVMVLVFLLLLARLVLLTVEVWRTQPQQRLCCRHPRRWTTCG